MCKVNTHRGSEIFLSLFLFGEVFFSRNLAKFSRSVALTCVVVGLASSLKNCQAKPSSICARNKKRIKRYNNAMHYLQFFSIFLLH